jgi:hypothetical protein
VADGSADIDAILGENELMSRRTPRDWPPGTDLTIERLAFLAARPQLVKRSSKGLPKIFRFLEAAGGMQGVRMRRGTIPSANYIGPGEDLRHHRMEDLVVACDTLAQQLHPEDKAILRISGRLPNDFLDRVEAEATRLHQDNRHGKR